MLPGTAWAAPATEYLQRAMPESWSYSAAVEQTMPSLDGWWSDFHDPALDSLISMGENNNFDLAMAARRVEQAQQAVRSARAGYYPSVNATAGWQRARSGGATDGGYSLGLQATWEPDIFGKVRAKVKQSGHSYNATKAEYTGAMVSVCAQIASTYFDLRTAQQQLRVATDHIASQKHVVDITVARHEAGLASALDVAQARTVLYSTEASLPLLDTQIKNDINTLATLCGVYAAEIAPLLEAGTGEQPDCNRIIATGVPAELLRRRPDIVEAESQVAAAAAALGIARKDYLPTLSITGAVGTAAATPGLLFGNGSFTWSVAPTLSWTVFDGMARRAGVVSAREAMEEQVANYNATVHTAVQEVENAITTYVNDLKRISTLAEVVEQSHKSLELSVDQYKQGLSAFTNVVDAQMNFLEYTNSLVSARGDALVSLATLYRAMGGGVNM
ncbi:MAG: efflux transporter outer membrane subunit [Muribaculaceae bacterium]|nr:efflux transporter outer membrane subunit [Muribaculaceae bacterium]